MCSEQLAFLQTLFLFLWYFCKVFFFIYLFYFIFFLRKLQSSYFVGKLTIAASRKHGLTFQPYKEPLGFGKRTVSHLVSPYPQNPRTTWVTCCMYSKVAHVFVSGHSINVTVLAFTGPP